jgi:RecA/RadA recombinase
MLHSPSPLALSDPARHPSETGSVDDLLRTLRASLPAALAERVRTGAAPNDASALPRLATGIAALDALLGGGFPRGRVSEITGPLSSGRTALALALVAAATRNGEIAAVVEASDAFDPEAAAAAGIDLARVLWARPPRPREALRCAERLLEARGFGVVVLDQDAPIDPRAGESIWLRMSRSATASGTALVLLASSTRAGPFAALSLEARATRVHFAAQPAWLEALDTQVIPVRARIGGIAGSAALAWSATPGPLNVKMAG